MINLSLKVGLAEISIFDSPIHQQEVIISLAKSLANHLSIHSVNIRLLMNIKFHFRETFIFTIAPKKAYLQNNINNCLSHFNKKTG